MKYIFIVGIGFLLGFSLVGGVARKFISAVAATSAPAGGTAKTATTPGGTAASAIARVVAEADTTNGVSAGAEKAGVSLKPARSRPQAFLMGPYMSLDGIPTDLANTPEVEALYKRAVIAGVEEQLSYARISVGLRADQYDQLVAVMAGQTTARTAIYAKNDRATQKGEMDTLSQETEAKLAEFMAPEQIELLAKFRLVGYAMANARDTFQALGMPLTDEQLRAMLVEQPLAIRPERGAEPVMYSSLQFALNSNVPGLTPVQREFIEKSRSAVASRLLISALRSTKVRDPEVFDIWPW